MSRDTYRHIRSAVFEKRPLSTDILEGEIAINYNTDSVGVFIRDTLGHIRKIGPAHVSDTPPSPVNYTDLSEGELWIDISEGSPSIRYWDASSTSWVSTGILDSPLNENNIVVGNTSSLAESYELNANSFFVDHTIGSLEVRLADNIEFGSFKFISETTLTGALYGPSQFFIDPAAQGDNTGEVIILGDLTVQGTTTTINSTTLEVEDKTIVVSKSATTPVEADNSGLVVAGSGSSLLYKVSTDSWNINKVLKGVYGDQSSPAFSFSDDAGLGLYRSADNQLSIATNSNERVRISDDLVTLVSNLDLVFDRGTYAGTITADTLTDNRTYTLPDVSGTIVTSSDTGTVTSAMIVNGTIVNEDISTSAAIGVSKLANGSARQLLQTDAAGTGVEWTNNIDVPGTLDVTGVATFDNKISIGAAEPATSQEVGWNTDKGTLDIGLFNGVISPYGQDIITLCRNNTASEIARGSAVMFTGTIGNSGRLTIAPMVSDGTYPGYVFFGVASQSIAAGADGYIRSFGEIKGVNTDIDEGGVDGQWAEGDILWCDPATPGGFTKFEPLAPNLKLPVAAVVSVKNNGIIFVRWDSGSRLQDLHDVDANGATTDGDVLQYNASATRWEHRTDVTLPGRVTINGTDITESARDIEESRLIRRNATLSIGIPGTVPFGVGPMIPPGMSLVGIGPDSYNVIDIFSGSVC